MRPHGINQYSFLVYLPDLHIKVTVTFWASMSLATLPAQCAFVSGFCSSGYDFAIPSSRLNLTIQTLGVAIEFVGNYASVDFHHRALICPSYTKGRPHSRSALPFQYITKCNLCQAFALKKRAKAQKFTSTKFSLDKHVENAKRDFSFPRRYDRMNM